MHKIHKVSFFMLFVTLMFALFVLPVYAETGKSEQDGISVSYTTDKEQYNDEDKIKATLKVTNNNSGSVYEIELDETIPKGFELAEGSLRYKRIAELRPGETQELETIFLKSKGSSDSTPDTLESTVAESGNGTIHDNSDDDKNVTTTPTKDTENTVSENNDNSSDKSSSKGEKKGATSQKKDDSPGTGDDQPVLVYIVVALVAGALIVLLTRGKWKKFFSFFLVLTMLETLIPGLDLEVKASNKEIQVVTNVKVGSESIAFTAAVKYSLSEPNNQYDEENVVEQFIGSYTQKDKECSKYLYGLQEYDIHFNGFQALLAEKIEYSIDSADEGGNVKVTITNVDFPEIYKSVLEEAPEDVTSEQILEKIEEKLVSEKVKKKVFNVNVKVIETSAGYKIIMDQELSNALFGGFNEFLSSLIAEEVQNETVSE